MKVILTHGYFLQEDPKERMIMRPYPPLGMLYVSAWLEKHGIDNEVFDSTFSSFGDLKHHLLEEKPDVLGIYTNLMTKLNVLRTVEFVRSQPSLAHTRVVLGGPEVRHHMDKFLEHGADVIVIGEGEETMLALVMAWQEGSDWRSIEGIAYGDGQGKAVQTLERRLIKNLDDLPLPNRNKIEMQAYFGAWKNKHGNSSLSINTMRGCPYTCKWCSRAVYGLSYRRRSPKHVVDELLWIRQNYDVDALWFVDDVFTISHKWLEGFVEEVTRRDAVIPFECITRADRMTPEVIDLLKRSGCFRVWIGAESGSQQVIDRMDRRVEVGQVRDMIRAAKASGIMAGTFIMVGYPGETEADIWETVDHLKSSDPDEFTITIAYPIKGTDLYSEVENRFVEDLPWEHHTDRDIDFHRTYHRKYYDFAVRLIVNEVHAAKHARNRRYMQAGKHKLKAMAALAAMKIFR